MKVRKLIEKLQQLNPNAEVKILWSEEHTTMVSYMWVSKRGDIILAKENDIVSDDMDTPEGIAIGDRIPVSYLTARQCAMHFNKGKKE